MDGATTTLLAGLCGSLLGGAASVLTVFVQTNAQRKRDLLKMATDLAVKDYELMDAAYMRNGEAYIRPPLVLHIHYHTGLMKLIHDGNFNDASYNKLVAENRRLQDQIRRHNRDEPKPKTI
jgi:uncharacterized iron-regulated protein